MLVLLSDGFFFPMLVDIIEMHESILYGWFFLLKQIVACILLLLRIRCIILLTGHVKDVLDKFEIVIKGFIISSRTSLGLKILFLWLYIVYYLLQSSGHLLRIHICLEI